MEKVPHCAEKNCRRKFQSSISTTELENTKAKPLSTFRACAKSFAMSKDAKDAGLVDLNLKAFFDLKKKQQNKTEDEIREEALKKASNSTAPAIQTGNETESYSTGKKKHGTSPSPSAHLPPLLLLLFHVLLK